MRIVPGPALQDVAFKRVFALLGLQCSVPPKTKHFAETKLHLQQNGEIKIYFWQNFNIILLEENVKKIYLAEKIIKNLLTY
jgi:hypothetical protein